MEDYTPEKEIGYNYPDEWDQAEPAKNLEEPKVLIDCPYCGHPHLAKHCYVPSKPSEAPESPSLTIAARLRVIPPLSPTSALEGVTELPSLKISDWHEEDHPRGAQTGKFIAKQDQHEVKQYDKKGKHQYTVKRCNKCGTLYGEKKGETVTSCPTCGEHPRRHGGGSVSQLRPQSADQNSIADSLGWRFWKTNHNGHRMYQWNGENQYGEVVPHTVVGYGNHVGQEEWNAKKLRKQMKSCMNGSCNHVSLPGAQTYDEPGAPVIRAGQEVVYGGKSWWVMDVDGGLAHIYDETGSEDVVPATDLKAAATIEDNKKFIEETKENWEDYHNDRDPDFVFVYFQGKLEVEAWEPNLRVRNMAEKIIKDQGFLGLGDYEEFANDTTSAWVTGEVWRTEAGNLRVEITQLADPDAIKAAEETLQNWFTEDPNVDYLHPVWEEVQ